MITLQVGGRLPHFYVIVFNVCSYKRPYVTGFVTFSKVSTLESVFKSLGLQCAFSPDTCGRKPDP